MSEPHAGSGKPDCGGDAAAYALGALEQHEAEAFRHHLETCAVCRDEVSTFASVVEALPLAAPTQRVPRSLKRRVMSEVSGEARRRRPAGPGWLAGLNRPALGAGLAAMAAVLVIAVVLVTSNSTGTRVIRASVASPAANVELRLSGGRGELVMARMPPPPRGLVYEVWVKRPAQPPAPTSALFDVNAAGSGAVEVPANLNGVSQVMVTAEPPGGSRSPTHPPVIVANLT
jgi:anti-sigma-K factor RskA